MKSQFSILKHLNIKNSFQIILAIVLLVFGFVGSVSAQEDLPSATESSKVDYQLSYPGLLPDHPLYFLKAARERVEAFFTSKPLNKAEFNLLQADKRVQASQMLAVKGKFELSQSTFSKAENYFEEAINNTLQAKTQGIHIDEVAKKLKDANIKHKEVLGNIVDALDKKNKKQFVTEAKRLTDFEKKVRELNPN